jgi:hypothetical protein
MPEALAVLVVFVVCVIAYVGALLRARDPSQFDPRQERARLHEQRIWLEHRRALARKENWDHGMIARIETDLAETSRALDKMAG